MCISSFLASAILLILINHEVALAQSDLTATLELTKAAYIEGEPIRARLRVGNTSRETATIFVTYPSFQSIGGPWITIKAVSDSSSTRRTEHATHATFGGGRFTILGIDPGDTWSVDIYLQRFTRNISIGYHDLEYAIDMQCSRGTHGPACRATGNGRMQFAVVPGGANQLSQTIAEYAKGLESSDFWTRRSAEEAMCVSDSPLVMQYLGHIIDRGLAPVFGVDALAKFRGNPESLALLLKTVRTSQTYQAVSAISILQGWNYSLPVDDFEALLSRQDISLRLAALQYAATVANPAYLPAISTRQADSDDTVAKEALRVFRVLTLKNQ